MGVAPDIHRARRASDLAQGLRALLGKLKRRLREQAGVGDLTPSQVSVLLRLEKDGPATASSLARAEGMRPQSMAPVIAALEDAGLVSGAPDPTDGRQTLLSLTDACRKLVNKGRAARQEKLMPRWFVIGISIFLSTMVVLTLNYNAWTNVQRESQLNQQLSADINQLTFENSSLQDEIRRLQTDPKTIEREARKLGMGRVNEKVFVPTQ